jgi:hypothetical protein
VFRRPSLTSSDAPLNGSTRRSAALVATLATIPVMLLVGVLVFWLLGGFDRDGEPEAAGPVRVSAPPDLPGADATCAKLLGALPHELAGATPRPVSDAPHRVVAWGDPAIVLRCGVDRPKALTPTAQVLSIEGVEWVYDDGKTTIWTTTSLALNVEVRVPEKYRAGAADRILNPLAAPLKATVPPAR